MSEKIKEIHIEFSGKNKKYKIINLMPRQNQSMKTIYMHENRMIYCDSNEIHKMTLMDILCKSKLLMSMYKKF